MRLLAAVVVVLMLGDTSAMAAPRRPEHALISAARAYVPAPQQFSIVYDNPKNAGGIDPATGQPYPAVGQYADTNTNTVHTTRGYSKRLIAQDVGQLVGSGLSAGDRNYFQRLLGTKTWDNAQGAQVGQTASGSEALADYYAIGATGGVKPGESVMWGETSIDPHMLRQVMSALGRVGRRNNLPALDLTKALTAAK